MKRVILMIVMTIMAASTAMARKHTVAPVTGMEDEWREPIVIPHRLSGRWPPAVCNLIMDKNGKKSSLSPIHGQTKPGQKATSYPIWNQDVVKQEELTGQKSDVARVRRLGYFQ
jgi:hypothetical protein